MNLWPRFLTRLVMTLLFAATAALAQGQTGRLHGTVEDPTGAVIPNAAISLKGESGNTISATSDGAGAYSIKDLAPGKYIITVSEKGFVPFTQALEIAPGRENKFNVTMKVYVEEQHVEVENQGTKVNVAPDNNASSVVISGKDLDALSDDPDELQSELQALAGPSAGPNGGQMYIDGFTGGQLPPKSSIREVRINQNPFSAEYDRMGFGRIEIFTKPGTDKYHGQFLLNDNHSIFDARNPFAAETALGDFNSQFFNASFGGPLSKKSSFLVSMDRRDIHDIALLSQSVVGVAPGAFATSVPNPHTRMNLSPRFDYQISANNSLTARYQFVRDTQENAGVGQLVLPSYGFNSTLTEHTVQLSDTQVLSAKAINETRFEYQRTHNDRNALNTGPAIIVLDAFTTGGNPIGISGVDSDHYEVQNYTSITHGPHFFRLGGRLRVTSESNTSTQNFNGTFIFSTLADFQNPTPAPAQFTMTTGQPTIANTFVDTGLYAEDDWKLRQNMTLSYGLRYETQNEIHDHGDWAPRLGFAWAVGGGKNNAAPKTVIRTGFGIFYDRVDQDLALQAERQNGVNQQQFKISPDSASSIAALASFPNTPPLSALIAASGGPTIYTLNPALRSPYMIQAAASVERQITRSATASVTYLHSRGVHQLVLLDVNALANPLDPGSRPNPALGDVYQYNSEADFKQDQLIGNVRVQAGRKLTLFSFYSLSRANSDTAGSGSVASDPKNISADYGRAAFDVHGRLFLGGSVGLPHGFRASPFMLFFTGAPFNITSGTDLNGDGIFNDRPAFATSATLPANLRSTSYGEFDVAPVAGEQIIPVNFGNSPSHFVLNLRLSKTIGLGPRLEAASPEGQQEGGEHHPGPHPGGGPRGPGRPGGGRGGPRGGPFGLGEKSDRKYSLTLGASARNLLNHTNPAAPVGNLSSPNFGRSNSLAGGPFNTQSANRRVDFQVIFSF